MSCSSLKQREKSDGRSVGRGRLLPVSPYSAVPGFIRPFTNTRRQTWAKTSCVEQIGFYAIFFLGLLARACPIKHRSTVNRTSDAVSAQVSFGEFCLSLASAIPHVWQAQAVTTLAAFIQLRPLKLQSMSSVFPLHTT